MAQGQPVPTRPVTAHGGNGGIKPGEAALEADFGSSDSIRDSDSDSDSGSDDEARETQQQLPSLIWGLGVNTANSVIRLEN